MTQRPDVEQISQRFYNFQRNRLNRLDFVSSRAFRLASASKNALSLAMVLGIGFRLSASTSVQAVRADGPSFFVRFQSICD
jgi:hypothetical protein